MLVSGDGGKREVGGFDSRMRCICMRLLRYEVYMNPSDIESLFLNEHAHS